MENFDVKVEKSSELLRTKNSVNSLLYSSDFSHKA